MTDIDALIERLEKAEGPSRELDAEIAVALRVSPQPGNNNHWAVKNFSWWTASKSGRVYAMHTKTNQRGPHWQSLEYTSSIDAALTLLGDDPEWSIERCHYDLHGCYRAVVLVGGEAMHMKPAIALCIAALRAKAKE